MLSSQKNTPKNAGGFILIVQIRFTSNEWKLCEIPLPKNVTTNRIPLEVFSFLGYIFSLCKKFIHKLSVFYIGRQKSVGSESHILWN